MSREQKFFNALRDMFVGAKIEGESGYINLMRIKSRYYTEGVFPRFQQDINEALKPFPGFRDELFEKLYDFFHRYFSESGSIYFRYTPLHQNIYEKVYTDDKDVMLFWKTHMLYYVTTDLIKQVARMVKEATAEYQGKRLKISHVANHYYIPMILSGETERVEYIKHIVQMPSEIKFLNRLEAYLAEPGHRFEHFDWWMFSKLDESIDDVYIPYYDGTSNKVRQFKPDFIFWLQKGENYFIIFIDPKGTEHTEYQRKIDGYSVIFEGAGGVKKPLGNNGKKVFVFAFLHTADKDGLPKPYRKHWFDDIGEVLASILASG